MNIGQRLKQLRDEKQLTQEDVGNIIGVTKATVNRYETGEIDIKRTIAVKLSKVFVRFLVSIILFQLSPWQ